MMRIKSMLIGSVLLAFSTLSFGQNFYIGTSTNGLSSLIRSAPAYVDNRVLAADVAETHTVPTGYHVVLFSSDCNFYARPNATAAVPAADVTDGTGSEQNPAGWYLVGLSSPTVTTISLIASVACKISLSFYKNP